MLKKNFLVSTSLLILCAVLAINTPNAYAGEAFPDKIEIPNKVNALILPSPTALMMALDGLGKKVFVPEAKFVISTSATKVYLNTGIVIADGVAAVKEKNKTKAIEYAEILYKYAQIIGIQGETSKLFLQANQSIQKSDWVGVIVHMDNLRAYINNSVREGRFAEEIILANASGWIEGLHIASMSLKQDFGAEQAMELFRYKRMPNYLLQTLENLPEQLKKAQEVQFTISTVKKISEIVSNKTSISKEDVDLLAKVTSDFRNEIMK